MPSKRGSSRTGDELIPTHVRYRPPRHRLQAPDGVGEYAETIRIAFFRALEQQLHPEADAQHRLSQRRQQLGDVVVAQAGHGVRGRSDAGQDDTRRGFDFSGVGRYVGFRTESLERELQRGEIGAAAVDDHGVHYSTPLVVGSSLLSRRNAWRSARPTPLKQASIM